MISPTHLHRVHVSSTEITLIIRSFDVEFRGQRWQPRWFAAVATETVAIEITNGNCFATWPDKSSQRINDNNAHGRLPRRNKRRGIRGWITVAFQKTLACRRKEETTKVPAKSRRSNFPGTQWAEFSTKRACGPWSVAVPRKVCFDMCAWSSVNVW